MAENSDHRFELLKLEYEKTADRYENVYRAIWQNFSYLSLISAAILTFGANQLETWATVFTAGIPLLFWFFGQFIPLDAYGRDVRLRLRDIETILNRKYFGIQAEAVEPEDGRIFWEFICDYFREWWKGIKPFWYTNVWRRFWGGMPKVTPSSDPRMAHFTEFAGQPRSDCFPRYPMRSGILVIGFILALIWLSVVLVLLGRSHWNLLHFVKDSTPQKLHLTADGSLDANKNLHVTADGSLTTGASPTPSPSPSPTASPSPSPTPPNSASPTGTSKSAVSPSPSVTAPTKSSP